MALLTNRDERIGLMVRDGKWRLTDEMGETWGRCLAFYVCNAADQLPHEIFFAMGFLSLFFFVFVHRE